MSLAPRVSSIFVMAVPAAPGPFNTMRQSGSARPATFSAFVSAAETTMAVPCWSSWKTGMSSSRSSASSISKHLGAAMSSRFMPPKLGARARTAEIISSGSWTSRQMGTASSPPNSRNSRALPSMTGMAARGPMFPRPSTAEPSETTATKLPRAVSSQTASGLRTISRQGSATPGV